MGDTPAIYISRIAMHGQNQVLVEAPATGQSRCLRVSHYDIRYYPPGSLATRDTLTTGPLVTLLQPLAVSSRTSAKKRAREGSRRLRGKKPRRYLEPQTKRQAPLLVDALCHPRYIFQVN